MYFLNRKVNFHYKIKKRNALVIIFLLAIIFFISVKNIRRIKIVDFNNTVEIYTLKKNVREILKQSKINFNSDVLVVPEMDSTLCDTEYTIRIYRTENIRSKKVVIIPQKTIEIETRALPKGQQLLINPGSKGFNEEIFFHKYIDGLKVKEELADVNVICKPRNKIVLIGISDRYIKNTEEELHSGKIVDFNASAYSPAAASCAPFDDGMTAIGLRADYGIAAVDPNRIPLGSLLFIEKYGYAIAGDVGSAIKSNSIDLCFRNHRIAMEFGRKKVKGYILD